MRLFNYKEFKDTPLSKIHAKYGSPEITLLRFRGRVYEGKMTMGEALTKPMTGRALLVEPFNVYLRQLYTKLSKTTEDCVSPAHFIVKMSKGFAPEIAIVSEYPSRTKTQSKNKKEKEKMQERVNKVKMKHLMEELRIQEQKEFADQKARQKKKVRPFTTREKDYVKNIDILDLAFDKVKNKEVAA